jgi:predicted dehydrogenase
MKLQRIAFVGVRGHYDWVLRTLVKRPDIHVAAVCRAGEESIEPILRWCDRNGHKPETFDDHLRMLEQAQPDAVVICGPLERHAEMAIDCVRRGVHVLVEKPVALHVADLESLRSALSDFPTVHLAALQTTRYQAGFFTARQLIQQGAVGDVRLINAQKTYKFGHRGEFFHNRETYGGTIPWVGSHGVDWILWVGGHRIRNAYAAQSTVGNDHNSGTMELAAMCQFGLCGERFASLSIDVLRPESAPTHGDDRLRIVGTGGVLEATPTTVRLINAGNDGNTPVELLHPPTLFDDFVAHVEGESEALIGAHDSLATTAACLLAREAADQRRVLDAESFTTLPLKSSGARAAEGSSRTASVAIA